MPRVPIAIVHDPAQDGAHLIGGEGFEFPGLAGHAIDQSGNVSRQASLGDELREDLPHDRLAAGASSQLNAPDLRWKLTALSHVCQALRRSLCMCCDEAVNL